MDILLSEENILKENKKYVDSALSAFKKNPGAVMNKPSSYLAHMRGLNIEQMYDKFIPLICKAKKIDDVVAYADLGVDILHFTDKNMWRSLLPEQFFFVFDRVVDIIKELLDDDFGHPDWLKRKGIKMQLKLMDVQADKRRLFEYIATEDKMKELQEAHERQKELEKEIIDIESSNG